MEFLPSPCPPLPRHAFSWVKNKENVGGDPHTNLRVKSQRTQNNNDSKVGFAYFSVGLVSVEYIQ